jgi:hypothetical protein
MNAKVIEQNGVPRPLIIGEQHLTVKFRNHERDPNIYIGQTAIFDGQEHDIQIKLNGTGVVEPNGQEQPLLIPS